MRTLSSTLLATQKKATRHSAVKVVVGSYTFYSGERVLSCTEEEYPFGKVSHILLDNSDQYLTDINLKGNAVTPSWGFVTEDGKEYSAAAPLKVIGQFFGSSPGKLICELLAVGDMTMMKDDLAKERFTATNGLFQHFNSGDDSAWNILGNHWRAQTFTTSSAHKIKRLKLKLRRSGKPGTLVISIKATDGSGHPTGADLVSVTYNANLLTDDAAGEWVVIDLDEYSLAASTKYAIALRVPDAPGGTEVYWRMKLTGGYAAGNAEYSSDGGSSWNSFSDYDLLFEEWGDGEDTVKDLISAIMGSTLTAFEDTPAYTVEYDSEDDLIDSYKPGDSFRVDVNTSKLGAFRRLIEFTHCVGRAEADGKVHIFVPTTTGTTYDYEYKLDTSLEHTFLNKGDRTQLVFPTTFKVYDDDYSGEAKDQDSIDAYHEVIKYVPLDGLESNDQAADIADALLARIKMDAEFANASVPMNVGAEIFDYVKITDKREGSTVVGNIGYIKRHYSSGEYYMEFRFGGWLRVRQLVEDLKTFSSGVADGGSFLAYDQLAVRELWVEHLQAEQIDLVMVETLDDLPDGSTYEKVLSTQISAGKILVSSATEFDTGYDPSDKFDLLLDTLDDVPDGATYKLVKATQITDGEIKLIGQIEVYEDYVRTSSASTRVELTSAGIKGLLNSVTQFEIRVADGKGVFAGGKCVLDAGGIDIDCSGGTTLFHLYYGSQHGYIYLESDGDMVLVAGNDIYWSADRLYGTHLEATDVNPSGGSATGYVGKSDQYWNYGYFNNLRYKDLDSFQVHDDIALLKQMEPNPQEPTKIDPATVPPEIRGSQAEQELIALNMVATARADADRIDEQDISPEEKVRIKADIVAKAEAKAQRMVEEGDPGIDLGKSIGLAFGAIRQLAERVEVLEGSHG